MHTQDIVVVRCLTEEILSVCHSIIFLLCKLFYPLIRCVLLYIVHKFHRFLCDLNNFELTGLWSSTIPSLIHTFNHIPNKQSYLLLHHINHILLLNSPEYTPLLMAQWKTDFHIFNTLSFHHKPSIMGSWKSFQARIWIRESKKICRYRFYIFLDFHIQCSFLPPFFSTL